MVFSNFIPIFPGCEGTARRENYANTACLQFQQLFEIAVSIIMLIWKHLLVLRKPILSSQYDKVLGVLSQSYGAIYKQKELQHMLQFITNTCIVSFVYWKQLIGCRVQKRFSWEAIPL
ncbi:uncharacterized protein LOC122962269 isoform X2 [Acropora millepora]|uniref:uncharacterized protein LOC122962269 isoform X2 n=1 Tax=Acropora millepora TaxID=45264 RepID=UPI001CF34E75|nr:uncharacterized protein LOC122962269 isoform X2 [Acropora millepora]